MKKELTLGTKVPANEINFASKVRELVNRVLPKECQVETAKDGWFVAAIGSISATLIFPPALIAAVYCLIKAKSARKEE